MTIRNIFHFMAAAALTLAGPAFAQSATRTRLLSSPNPSTFGQQVRLTAEVDGLGGGAPTGSVAFRTGSTFGSTLGWRTLAAVGAGQATIAAGRFHTCAMTSAGGVECWGWNGSGQLGDGTTADRLTPTPVVNLSSGVAEVGAGNAHSCALTRGGAVKCWGANGAGQLGDGTRTNRTTPRLVSGLSSGVVAIAAGGWPNGHSCALSKTGALTCWGDNSYGQLGDGTTSSRSTPTPVIGLSSGVVAMAVDGRHSCALTRARAVKCWGANYLGQLGDGTKTNRPTPTQVFGLSSGVVAIATGGDHTCALTSARAVKCWGDNHNGQLGDGTTTNRLTPTPVFGLSSGVVAVDGAGGGHSCALTSAGALKCWGANGNGQIGDGTMTRRLTPTQVFGLTGRMVAVAAGDAHFCASTRAGAMICWGENANGQIGDGTTTRRLTPVTTSGFAGLVRARAKLSTTALGIGEHTLKAFYPGDARHSGSGNANSRTVH